MTRFPYAPALTPKPLSSVAVLIGSVPIDQKSSSKNETVLFLNKYVTFHSYLIKLAIKQERDICFYYIIIDKYKLQPKLIKIKTKDKSIHQISQSIANEMTTIIKKYPEQYFWPHNRFNIS